MKNSLNKGFTLIELLVVIAIIGLLSAVVLAALSTTKTRGNDASVKTSLAHMRSQSEIFYGAHSNSYGLALGTGPVPSNPCITTGDNIFGTTTTGTLKNMVVNLKKLTGDEVACASSNSAWAVMASTSDILKPNWCVDSTGNSVATSSGIFTPNITCM